MTKNFVAKYDNFCYLTNDPVFYEGINHGHSEPYPKHLDIVKKYLAWGAGPRASQFLVLGAKCHAVINGKYSPDIEDVKAVANAILRHRIIRNYKAEADGMSIEAIIEQLK